MGRRRENKNAVALDSEQVTNLCFNTSTAIELAVWNEIADKNTIFHYVFNPAPLYDPCPTTLLKPEENKLYVI